MGQITKRSCTSSPTAWDIIYFDDADTVLPPHRGEDLRAPAVRPPTATMRQVTLTGEWISIAAARQNRVVLPPSHLDPLAPASPENPSEIPSLYDVAVFENKSPSFGPDLAGAAAPEGRTTSPGWGWDAAGSPWAGAKWCASPRNTPVPWRDCPGPGCARWSRRGRTGRPRCRAARRRAGLSVREPRRGDRGDAASPARPDLRLPLRHAAHGPAGRSIASYGRPAVRGHPRLREQIRAGAAPGRALDGVCPVCRALAAGSAPPPAPARPRPRRHDGRGTR